MAIIKKISEMEQLHSLSDASNVIIEENGVAKRFQAIALGGGSSYYSTTREEVGAEHENITAEYIWSLYSALSEKYPGVKVEDKEHKIGDEVVNHEFVITTGDYPSGLYSSSYTNDSANIKKPKYLILSSIHGVERKAAISAYRFIRDILEGRNVPQAFREGVIISVIPVGSPYAFNKFQRCNKSDVDINRNFKWHWVPLKKEEYSHGDTAESENETQVIVKWLTENRDADLFIDFHNSSNVNENVAVLGLFDNDMVDTAKKTALRGLDRVIPFWRNSQKYQAVNMPVDIKEPEGQMEKRPRVYAYSASITPAKAPGVAIGYAQDELGICSIAVEVATYLGGYDEWYKDKYTYQPEVIAMGAEALGNILIEFYNHSMLGEVEKMNIRMKTGTYHQDSTQKTVTTIEIPCGKKFKALELYADGVTMSNIYAVNAIGTTEKYMTSLVVSPYAVNSKTLIGINSNGKTYGTKGLANYIQDLSASGCGWDTDASPVKITETEDGISVKVYGIVKGDYNWTAYYWD